VDFCNLYENLEAKVKSFCTSEHVLAHAEERQDFHVIKGVERLFKATDVQARQEDFFPFSPGPPCYGTTLQGDRRGQARQEDFFPFFARLARLFVGPVLINSLRASDQPCNLRYSTTASKD